MTLAIINILLGALNLVLYFLQDITGDKQWKKHPLSLFAGGFCIAIGIALWAFN